MSKLSLFLICIFISVSCGEHANIKKDFKLLMSKPIKMPSNATIYLNSKDTIIENYFNSDYKMVIYIDSTSCSSCALGKLFLWQDLIDYSEKSEGKLKFYFIFSPPKNENIRILLRNCLLKYPMLLDFNGEFEKINTHLPKNFAMHTFLLNKQNKVVLVGNPSTNKKIEEIFYKKTIDLF